MSEKVFDQQAVAQPQVWDIEMVRPYENNAKVHTKEQIKKIAQSIKKFGFDQPIVVDGAGVIIKGHGRWEAAKYLGMDKVVVVVRHDLTANEAKASRLADNRVAVGDVDTNKLNEELFSLSLQSDQPWDLSDLGFSEKELDFMTSDLAEMDESALMEDLEEELAEAVSETEDAVAAVASKQIQVKTVLGFNTIPGDKAKMVARWMSAVEGETGLTGAEAFCAYVESVTGDV